MPQKYGFNAVHHLAEGGIYQGDADFVILVWNELQLLPADQYRQTHHANQRVDVVICAEPDVLKQQLGRKAVVYHFSSASGGGQINE